MFENRALRKTFFPKSEKTQDCWRELRNEELCYYIP